MKISVPNFQNYGVMTYRFRKILAWYIKLTCFVALVHFSFALNARGYANVGIEIMSSFASNFTINESLPLLFYKDFVKT